MPDSIHDIFLGRQPILDRDPHIVPYELLLRSSHNLSTKVTNDLRATRAFCKLETASVLDLPRETVVKQVGLANEFENALLNHEGKREKTAATGGENGTEQFRCRRRLTGGHAI